VALHSEPVTTSFAPAADSRRAEILATAAEVFAAHGVRTSVKDIADACGILPGSLYHHFESKDAIVVELIQGYQDDVDEIARAGTEMLDAADGRTPDDLLIEIAGAMARCTHRHRGALQLTFYELPEDIRAPLRRDISTQTAPVESLLERILRIGQVAGTYRADLDIGRLATRLTRSMISAGVRAYGNTISTPVAPVSWGYLRDGVAVEPPEDRTLDRSDALRAACDVVASWHRATADEDDRMTLVRSVARAEFGRRGYQATTIRDIAGAAGLSTATVHRLIGSKDELLGSVMRSFASSAVAGWTAVLDSRATAVEKLDALSWIHINLFQRFGDEFKIGLAWTVETPTERVTVDWSFDRRLADLTELFVSGLAAGELQAPDAPVELQTRCLLELTWMPDEFVRKGPREAHLFGRDVLLRGAAVRS
jgi:AcrR family transcriptional regulator